MRLHQVKCGLVALDLLGKLRHDLRLAGLLPLPGLGLLASVSQLTVRALRSVLVLVVGDQCGQRRFSRLQAICTHL